MVSIIICFSLKSVEVLGLGARRFPQKLATVRYDCLTSGLPGRGTRPDLRTSFDGGILAKAPGARGGIPSELQLLRKGKAIVWIATS
jgi:hypothetical protein